MKLIGSRTSPFVRKVRVLLAEKGLAYDFVEDSAWSAKSAVPDHNPLNKVPVMVTQDGENLYDSAVIAEYVDALGSPRFVPAEALQRARVRRDEALGDGIADAGILIMLEKKREPGRQDAAWIDRQRQKVNAGIGELGRRLAGSPYVNGDELSLGDIACACALLWLEFRMPDIRWRSENPAIAAWVARIEARDSFRLTQPPAA